MNLYYFSQKQSARRNAKRLFENFHASNFRSFLSEIFMWVKYAALVKSVGKSISLSETFFTFVQCFQYFQKAFPIKIDF